MPMHLAAHPYTEHHAGSTRMGFDLVEISQVEDSIARFGDTYKRRVFTPGELAYAEQAEGVCAERLAARFAAKEAFIKALQPGDEGIDLREIEVVKQGSGACRLQLHGRIASIAAAMGVTRTMLSMSHDGGFAGAVVNLVLDV